MKLINSFILAFIFFFAASTQAFSQTANVYAQADTLKKSFVKVKGVTCSMDLKSISANVEKLKGVSSCKTGKQGPTTTFEVHFNPLLVTEKEIYAAIEGTGGCHDPNERPYKVKL